MRFDGHTPAHDVERFPLIAFVHVPKTGGTTVNRVLWSCSHRGLEHHGEGIPRPELLDGARQNDWLSAHIPRELFASSLIWLDRPIEYFSAVREPVSQLLSHLNWQFEIHNRGPEFLREYPPLRLEISEQVRATDFSKTSSIVELIHQLGEPFFNCQALYILGYEYATISDNELARRVASFSYIATEKDLPSLYRAFGFATLPSWCNELRENQSQKYHFDTSLFQSKEIKDLLAERHYHDFRVYNCVRQTSWSAEGRSPFRPAFPIVTADKYDERAYLATNPDVAEALKSHQTWRSGYDHFVAHGQGEKRRQLILPSEAMTNQSNRINEMVNAEAFHWGAETAVSYHGAAARDMDQQWKTLIEPVLAQYPIDYSRTIDFAAGYGRNTRKLLEAGAAHVTMVDVNPECVAHLETHFPHDRASAVLNDGAGLAGLGTSAFTFLYTFDSMVHFDLEIVMSYIPEFARVLTPGAHAFVHHSNYTANPGGDFRQNPHWRNFMSAAIFKHIAVRSGFDVIQQETFSWGEPDIDCITVLRRTGG